MYCFFLVVHQLWTKPTFHSCGLHISWDAWLSIFEAAYQHADLLPDYFSWIFQVQEKKVKKISDLNIDPSRGVAKGSMPSSSVSSSQKQYLANGCYTDGSSECLSNDLSFPPGGLPGLRLPVVIGLKLYMHCLSSGIKFFYMHWFLLPLHVHWFS